MICPRVGHPVRHPGTAKASPGFPELACDLR